MPGEKLAAFRKHLGLVQVKDEKTEKNKLEANQNVELQTSQRLCAAIPEMTAGDQ